MLGLVKYSLFFSGDQRLLFCFSIFRSALSSILLSLRVPTSAFISPLALSNILLSLRGPKSSFLFSCTALSSLSCSGDRCLLIHARPCQFSLDSLRKLTSSFYSSIRISPFTDSRANYFTSPNQLLYRFASQFAFSFLNQLLYRFASRFFFSLLWFFFYSFSQFLSLLSQTWHTNQHFFNSHANYCDIYSSLKLETPKIFNTSSLFLHAPPAGITLIILCFT